MISAGDAQFLEKAQRRIYELMHKANIIALASHNLGIIGDFCNKVLWLEHGTIRRLGPAEDVLREYESSHPHAANENVTGATAHPV